ncbi:MAG: EamA family transporter [Beijerinckiaceae bacterium]
MSVKLPILGLILLSVTLNAAAQLFLRAALRSGISLDLPPAALALDVGLRPGVIVGIACYGVSLLLTLFVLSNADASFVYPFLGLGFVIVAVASYLLLGEPMTPRKIAGTLIIAAGIVILAGG